MVKLEIELEELDYDMLIDQFLPQLTQHLRASGNPIGMLLSNGMTASVARTVLRSLSQEQKDQLTCDLLNNSKERLISSLEEGLAQKGFHLKVHSASASAHQSMNHR